MNGVVTPGIIRMSIYIDLFAVTSILWQISVLTKWTFEVRDIAYFISYTQLSVFSYIFEFTFSFSLQPFYFILSPPHLKPCSCNSLKLVFLLTAPPCSIPATSTLFCLHSDSYSLPDVVSTPRYGMKGFWSLALTTLFQYISVSLASPILFPQSSWFLPCSILYDKPFHLYIFDCSPLYGDSM